MDQVVQVEVSSEVMERGASPVQIMKLTEFYRVRVGVIDSFVAHFYRAHLDGLCRCPLVLGIVHCLL